MSTHYRRDRKYRERRIKRIGDGEIYAEFIVDRGHENGAEKHVITTNGIIIVYNANSGKLVTKLIARPGQIRRYFAEGEAPAEIIEAAYQHTANHLNV